MTGRHLKSPADEMSRVELELARLQAEVRRQALSEEKLQMELERVRGDHADWQSSDSQNCCYLLSGELSGEPVRKAIGAIQGWHRRFPLGQDITIIINCSGGSVLEGFALYDTILAVRHGGRRVVTVARGQAASMGSVLLQAGDHRLIGENSCLLIHQTRWSGEGPAGNHEDLMDLSRMLEARALRVLSERSSLSRDELHSRWSRRDWWLSASEAVKMGFVDGIE